MKAESDIWQIIYNFCQILNLLSRRITLLRWWVTTISINMVPIPQNYNTNLERKLANHFDYSPQIVFNRTYERKERHNPPLNGSSIDNIAEGVQGLCGKVNYSPLGKKQPHNLPYKLPTHTFPHHTKTFRNSNSSTGKQILANKNHPRIHCAFGSLCSLLSCWPRCPCQNYSP